MVGRDNRMGNIGTIENSANVTCMKSFQMTRTSSQMMEKRKLHWGDLTSMWKMLSRGSFLSLSVSQIHRCDKQHSIYNTNFSACNEWIFLFACRQYHVVSVQPILDTENWLKVVFRPVLCWIGMFFSSLCSPSRKNTFCSSPLQFELPASFQRITHGRCCYASREHCTRMRVCTRE